MFLITTNSVSPFAIGRWSDESSNGKNISKLIFTRTDPLQRQIDPWGKVDGNFNNLEHLPTPYSQDPNGLDWPYFDRLNEDRLILEEMKLSVLAASTAPRESESNLLKKLKQRLTSSSTEETFINNYKNNLAKGFIDDDVFRVPEVILKH